MGDEHGKSDAEALAVTSEGVWVGGKNGSRGFANATVPWSTSTVSGDNDVALTRFRFD
jgi:hypothetical protein